MIDVSPSMRGITDLDLRMLVGTYEATPEKARSINQSLILRCLLELQILREWASRAHQVLPLIRRDAGTELSDFVGALMRGDVPPSTGAPKWHLATGISDEPSSIPIKEGDR